MTNCDFRRISSVAGRNCPAAKRGRAGFTLIELLVVVTIIGILAGLSVAGVFKALDMASSLKESNAAKALITSYLSAASDNNGFFIPGYDRTVNSAQAQDGSTVTGPVAQRYPYRLAPYFNYDIKGTLLTSNNRDQFAATDFYQVSTYPSFGINYIFVGGDVSSAGDITTRGECLQVAGRGRGASILVFATAADLAAGGTGEHIEGYCKLEPPKRTSAIWSSSTWTSKSSPRLYGQVDARHGGKVICAFSDGSVRKLSIEEMRDMRLWSYRAADKDDPNYTIGGG